MSRGWTHRGDPAAAAAVDGMLQNDIKPATRAAWAVDTVRRARACYEKQDFDAAIKFCEQAMDLDASYVASYTLRGAALASELIVCEGRRVHPGELVDPEFSGQHAPPQLLVPPVRWARNIT